jgi:hypothetical protein
MSLQKIRLKEMPADKKKKDTELTLAIVKWGILGLLSFRLVLLLIIPISVMPVMEQVLSVIFISGALVAAWFLNKLKLWAFWYLMAFSVLDILGMLLLMSEGGRVTAGKFTSSKLGPLILMIIASRAFFYLRKEKLSSKPKSSSIGKA